MLFDLDGNDFGIAPEFLLTPPLIVLFDREKFPASEVSILLGFRKMGGLKSAKTLLFTSRTRSARSASVFFSAMLFMIASHLPGARGFRDSEKEKFQIQFYFKIRFRSVLNSREQTYLDFR